MIAKAKFDYTADPKYAQTMTIKADEILVDVEEIGDEMRGTSEISKERGLFPASYVTIIFKAGTGILSGHSKLLNCVALSQNNLFVVSGDGNVKVRY